MSETACIGLGSNLGDRRAQLDAAVEAIGAIVGVELTSVSSYHETRPAGGPAEQPQFLNAAARVETTLEPEALLAELHALERRAGRIRDERWGPRTVDLDLLTYGDRVILRPELTVPHPRMAVRRFVVAPLSEIASDVVEPVTRMSIRQLLNHLDRRPSYVAIDAENDAEREVILRRVVSELEGQEIEDPQIRVRFSWRPRLVRRIRHVERHMDALSAAVARSSNSPEQWLVSAFIIDMDCARLGGEFLSPALRNKGVLPFGVAVHFDRFWRPLRRMEDCRRPTIGVLLGSSWERSIALELPFPVLCPEAGDPDSIAGEILAACRASRPG
jgi:2-amino-4-hydroxy-6-hydroxymethyldihydropteridine diphosphokinase